MTMRGGGGIGGRLLAVGVVGLVGLASLTACGDDDDAAAGGDSAAAPYVDALEQAMTSSNDSGIKVSGTQADCLAPKFVAAIGVDTFEAKGVTAHELGANSDGPDLQQLGLSAAQGDQLVEAFGDCDVDLKSIFLQSLSSQRAPSAEDEQCLETNFPDDLVNQVMVMTLTQGEDALQNDPTLMGQLQDVMSKCPGAIPTG